MYPVFDASGGTWTVRFDAPLDGFPSGDTRADLARINRIFEDKIVRAPEQYWWIHRRFKTRPDGEPPFYD
jgi:KDO2-lipid IV(A) lauroyltransferase